MSRAADPSPRQDSGATGRKKGARLDKAMALAMQHDLQAPLPTKKRLRRLLQRLLAGRRWPASGEDEFFRKAVRRHELLWVLKQD